MEVDKRIQIQILNFEFLIKKCFPVDFDLKL
jgi:hypothetical protein